MSGVNNRVVLGHHLGSRLLLMAVGFGIFADGLLRVTPWGLNLLVVVVGGLVATSVLSRWGGVQLEGEGRWLAVPMLFFAVGLAWRDSPTLDVANGLGLLVSACLAALCARAGQVRRAGVTQYALGVLYVVLFSVAGLLPVLRWDFRVRQVARGWWVPPAVAAGRGVLLALPPLLLFGNLFMAADAEFDRLVRDTFHLDLGDALVRVSLVTLYAWLIGGALREMLLAPTRERQWLSRVGARAGVIEVAVALVLLDALFASFVLVQLPYLFGGLSEVARIGYSEYARRGFFELVWVAGLTLPLLLLAHWLVRGASTSAQRLVSSLAVLLVGLLYLVMLSAVQRMALYVADNGLTELRVQASAFMAWLGVVLAWFVLTVLRGYRQWFGFGALASAFVILALLDTVNPDALIVQTNARFGHLEARTVFDERPLASFSPDATPAIVEALPLLSAEARTQVEARLERQRRWLTQTGGDWRALNLSRDAAARALGAKR